MTVTVVVFLIWLSCGLCLSADFELVEVKEIPQGKVEVSWTADGLENLDFSILYGIGQDSVGPPIEWHALDDLPCCTIIISQLQARTVYTFKVAVNVGNDYRASASKTIRMREGVPLPPRDLTVNVQSEVNNSNRTCAAVVAWTQTDAADVEYYNVSVVLPGSMPSGRELVLQVQTSHTHVTIHAIPNNTSFDVYVVAVNPYGMSREVTAHHYAVDVTHTSGEPGIVGGRLFWVILAPVMTMLALVAVIAVGIHCNRRRSHLNLPGSKADNGLSYMPLRLSSEQHESGLSRTPRWASGVAGQGDAQSTSNNIHRTSLQGRRSEVNRIGRSCETSPHKAQFQLVSDSPRLRGERGESLALGGGGDTLRPRPDSLMSTPPGSQRTSKRTPIIPLSEEKLLSRVTSDPGRYPSWGGGEQLVELMGSD